MTLIGNIRLWQMIRFCVSALGLSALVFAIPLQSHAAQSSDLEIREIVRKVRDTYATLRSWEFSHNIVYEEFGNPPTLIRAVSTLTAGQVPNDTPSGLNDRTICGALCRLHVTTESGRIVLVKDLDTTWLSSSAYQFTKGVDLPDVVGSVAAAALAAIHLTSINSFREEDWDESRLLSDETIVVGGEQRDCYVLEATLKLSAVPLDVTKPRASSIDAFWRAFSILATASRLPAAVGSDIAYVSQLTDAEPERVRFWIDKTTSLILRRTIFEQRLKGAWEADGSIRLVDKKPVPVQMTATMTATTIAQPPETLFQFHPDSNMRELPNQFLFQPVRTSPDVTNLGACANESMTAKRADGATTLITTADMEAYYRESTTHLVVSLEAPFGWSPRIEVDVNQDGKKGEPDVAYATAGAYGRICTQHLLSENLSSICGTFHSNATLELKPLVGRTQFSWSIPKTEVTTDGTSVRLQIGVTTPQINVFYPPTFTDACRIPFATTR
jgi:hypothetical protein